jgi:hypothetical protein
LSKPSSLLALLSAVLLSIWCVGMLGRGYWTPDEPREADISWRMSWQADKAVPLLAGEPFCEKPPLTYWLAAMPIELLGVSAWAARLPNVLYAMITALAVGLLARRAAGSLAAFAARPVPRILRRRQPRSFARLSADACGVGRWLLGQECGRLDGTGARADDADRLGKTLA